jgi:hypothetical protein
MENLRKCVQNGDQCGAVSILVENLAYRINTTFLRQQLLLIAVEEVRTVNWKWSYVIHELLSGRIRSDPTCMRHWITATRLMCMAQGYASLPRLWSKGNSNESNQADVFVAFEEMSREKCELLLHGIAFDPMKDPRNSICATAHAVVCMNNGNENDTFFWLHWLSTSKDRGKTRFGKASVGYMPWEWFRVHIWNEEDGAAKQGLIACFGDFLYGFMKLNTHNRHVFLISMASKWMNRKSVDWEAPFPQFENTSSAEFERLLSLTENNDKDQECRGCEEAVVAMAVEENQQPSDSKQKQKQYVVFEEINSHKLRRIHDRKWIVQLPRGFGGRIMRMQRQWVDKGPYDLSHPDDNQRVSNLVARTNLFQTLGVRVMPLSVLTHDRTKETWIRFDAIHSQRSSEKWCSNLSCSRGGVTMHIVERKSTGVLRASDLDFPIFQRVIDSIMLNLVARYVVKPPVGGSSLEHILVRLSDLETFAIGLETNRDLLHASVKLKSWSDIVVCGNGAKREHLDALSIRSRTVQFREFLFAQLPLFAKSEHVDRSRLENVRALLVDQQ